MSVERMLGEISQLAIERQGFYNYYTYSMVCKMKRFILLMCLGLFGCVSSPETYKCINSEGLIVYKDSECDKSHTGQKITKPDTDHDNTLDYEIVIEKDPVLGKNLILNGTFENKLVDWRVPLDTYWSNNAGVNKTGALVIQAKEPPKNKYIYQTKVQQCVRLNDGMTFSLSAKFRHSKIPAKAHANRANVVWYEAAGCSAGGQYGGYIEPKMNLNGWQEISNSRLRPALGAKSAMVTIHQRGRFSNGGQGIWDNIEFSATEVHERSTDNVDDKESEAHYTLDLGQNYLLNGSFDINVESWRAGNKVSWSDIQGDAYPGSAKVDAVSTSSSIGSGGFSQCVNIGNNKKFVLGGSFKRDENSTQKGDARLRLTWYGGNNCSGRAKTSNKSRNPKAIPGWQRLIIDDLIPPANAKSAVVEIIKVVSGKGMFTAYWDDIYLKAVE